MAKWNSGIRFQLSAVWRKAVNWEEQICFLSIAEQSLLLIRWHGFISAMQLRKKCCYMKGIMERRWRRGLVLFENGRHVTWSFHCFISKCFAPLFWLKLKGNFLQNSWWACYSCGSHPYTCYRPEEAPSLLMSCLSFRKSYVLKTHMQE